MECCDEFFANSDFEGCYGEFFANSDAAVGGPAGARMGSTGEVDRHTCELLKATKRDLPAAGNAPLRT